MQTLKKPTNGLMQGQCKLNVHLMIWECFKNHNKSTPNST